MTARIALLALLALGGCHRAKTGVAPDARAETQARTSAKALSDVAAAEEAASAPLPATARAAPVEAGPEPDAVETPAAETTTEIVEPGNEAEAR